MVPFSISMAATYLYYWWLSAASVLEVTTFPLRYALAELTFAILNQVLP